MLNGDKAVGETQEGTTGPLSGPLPPCPHSGGMCGCV